MKRSKLASTRLHNNHIIILCVQNSQGIVDIPGPNPGGFQSPASEPTLIGSSNGLLTQPREASTEKLLGGADGLEQPAAQPSTAGNAGVSLADTGSLIGSGDTGAVPAASQPLLAGGSAVPAGSAEPTDLASLLHN